MKSVRKAQALKIFLTPKEEKIKQGLPLTRQELATYMGVNRKTMWKWLEDLPRFVAQTKLNAKDIKALMETSLASKSYDPEDWLKNRTEEADRALMVACANGNAAALKLFNQLTNRLVEKSEQKVEIGLSADEIARRNLEAERRVTEFGSGYRVESLSSKPPLLPQEIRQD